MAEIKIYANLAQLIEQMISNQQVVGLNPTVSSNNVSVLTEHTDVTLKNGLKMGQVIPESIAIKKVFLAEKNPVVKLGLVIK